MIKDRIIMFIKHGKNYYLKKIDKGTLSVTEVANIFHTSPKVIEQELINYENRSNPFIKKKSDKNYSIIQIIISVVSTLLVLFTLFEMKVDRNAAYRPSLSISNTETAIAWNQDGKIIEDEDNKKNFANLLKDSTIINITPQMLVYNIGVGTAKNVTFEWNHEKNINQFVEKFNQYNGVKILSVEENGVIIESDSSVIKVGYQTKVEFEFLPNTSPTEYSIIFPRLYYDFITQLCSYAPLTEHDLCFELTVSYCDIQGKEYFETLYITPEPYFFIHNEDGSGYGVYTLTSKKDNKNMNAFNLSNINGDMLMAITSVCAVIISVMSMVFTIIFSILQVKHNKNSVRPISAIQVKDYEDLLSVEIKNVGTGPLTITKLIAKNDTQQSSELIELLPHIGQPWSTFVEKVDGWTIPAGEKIVLVELQPLNDKIKKSVRRSLAKTTIVLHYTDIYKTRFYDERKLDFFGRHDG